MPFPTRSSIPVVGAVLLVTVTLASCSASSSQPPATSLATTSTTASAGTSTISPRPPTTTSTYPTVAASQQLPVSVESDSQMRAEANNGPTSSVLLPSSCKLVGSTVTAMGAYQGGFAPNVYSRYGDIVVLYVFGPPSPGFPQGPQLAVSSAQDSPPLSSGTWQVSTSVSTSLDASVGQPARCVVAAQPTHDVQLAP